MCFMFNFSALKNEPIYIFFVISIALFASDYYLNKHKNNVINVTSEVRMDVVTQSMRAKGGALTPAEEITAINTYIDEEIMLAEALRLGFRNDQKLDTRLLRNYRLSVADTMPEPTAAELEAYYSNHLNEYMSPVMWDIQQVYFGVGASIPKNLIIELRSANNIDSLAEKLQLNLAKLPKMSEQEISGRMGKNVADAVIKTALNSWAGPLENERGIYFIRAVASYESTVMPLLNVNAYVRDALLKTRQDAILQEKIAALKTIYTITIANGEKN